MSAINIMSLLGKYGSRALLSRSYNISNATCIRYFAGTINFSKSGDKIPINYTKDMKAPEVLEDSAYPAWVFDLNKKLPSKEDLIESFKANPEGLTEFERKRLKKLISKTRLHENNLLAESSNK